MQGGLFQTMGLNALQRKVLFYSVCVPTRATLAYMIYRFSHKDACRIIVMNIALVSILLNTLSRNIVWWRRDVHTCTGMLMLCLLSAKHVKASALVMVLDLVFGIVSSMLLFQ